MILFILDKLLFTEVFFFVEHIKVGMLGLLVSVHLRKAKERRIPIDSTVNLTHAFHTDITLEVFIRRQRCRTCWLILIARTCMVSVNLTNFFTGVLTLIFWERSWKNVCLPILAVYHQV